MLDVLQYLAVDGVLCGVLVVWVVLWIWLGGM